LTATAANSSGKAYSLSAVIPAGPGAVVASYAKNKMDATAGGLQDSAKGMTLGYLYSLSKTTTIYAAYSKMSQDKGTKAYSVFSNGVAGSTAAVWAAGGGSSSQLALGINKKF
jgi:predicted porin